MNSKEKMLMKELMDSSRGKSLIKDKTLQEEPPQVEKVPPKETKKIKEPEITMEITEKEYEMAGGNINKFFENNIDKSAFDIYDPNKVTEESEKPTCEKEVFVSSMPKKLTRKPKPLSFSLIDFETGATTEINKPYFTIGSGKSQDGTMCDLIIGRFDNPKLVSRHHATIYLKDDKAYLVDRSLNGTVLKEPNQDSSKGIKLSPGTEMLLKNGNIILFADKKYLMKIK